MCPPKFIWFNFREKAAITLKDEKIQKLEEEVSIHFSCLMLLLSSAWYLFSALLPLQLNLGFFLQTCLMYLKPTLCYYKL
jgi:hypothetical protein